PRRSLPDLRGRWIHQRPGPPRRRRRPTLARLTARALTEAGVAPQGNLGRRAVFDRADERDRKRKVGLRDVEDGARELPAMLRGHDIRHAEYRFQVAQRERPLQLERE